MATDSALRSVTNTLSGTTADTITLTQLWPAVEITNHHATNPLYARLDGTTAVGAANDNTIISAGQSKVVRSIINTSNQITVSVVGDGNVYTVEGVH